MKRAVSLFLEDTLSQDGTQFLSCCSSKKDNDQLALSNNDAAELEQEHVHQVLHWLHCKVP